MSEVGQPDPWKIFRRFWGFGSYGYGWTDERLLINDYLETGVSFQFLNYWNFNVGGGGNGDAYDDLDTRGGPPIFKPGNTFLFFNANSDSRKALAAQSWRQSSGETPSAARAATRAPACRFNPRSRPGICLAPTTAPASTSRSGSPIRTPTATALLDHVYGTLDRDVVDMTSARPTRSIAT